MSDPTLFNRLRQSTADFKKDLAEQKKILAKLKGVGETLADISGEADPIIDVINDVASTIDSMDSVVAKLDKLKLPGA